MNVFNLSSRVPVCFSLILALSLTGCATLDTATQKVGGVFGSKSDTTKSATGGAILGCGAGAVVSKLMGKSMLAGCAIGGATGGIASVQIHKRELANANALAAEANAAGAGVKATVATKTVDARDDATGAMTKTEVYDSLTIDLPAAEVKQHSAAVSRVLAKAGVMADGAADPTTIEIRGTIAQRAWVGGQIRSSLKPGSRVKLVDVDATAPRLVITPVPAIEEAK